TWGRDHGPGTDPIVDALRLELRQERTRHEQTDQHQTHQLREKSPAEKAALEVEIEEVIEEGLRAETEDEEETPAPKPAKKRKRMPPTETRLQRNSMSAFLRVPMRFRDVEALHMLWIYEDVRLLLRNMDMESLLGMSYIVHEEVSCQFLYAFAIRYHCEAHKTEGFGRITFQIDGKTHKVGFKKLGFIFGFSDKRGSFVPPKSAIVDDILEEISGWSRIAGEDKSTDISNPGVRYAQKILTHTFYSRREPGGANDDELKLLALGLLPIFEEGTLLHTDPEDFGDMGLVGLLMKRFDLITPILEALGIDLGPRDHAPASIDLAYLKKTHFLAGQSGDRFAYPFWSRDEEPEQLQIFLPSKRLTTLSDPQHVAFTPAAHELIPTDFGALENITKSCKKKTRASSSRAARPSDADDEGPITPAPVYGTERYHFRPYGGVTMNVALRQALSQNAKLLRWNKMQDSTIYKLKNSVKMLKRQMKKVTSLLSQVSIGSGCQRDDVMAGSGPYTLSYPVYYMPPRSPEYQ
ncbi:LOW QUALITY PROTEIN: hypothetical protein HID58_065556, partial [Brassica napus]